MQLNLYNVYENEDYRESIISSLSNGITDKEKVKEFNNVCNYFINNKLQLFKDIEINNKSIGEYILPIIRRLWSNFFVNLPDVINIEKDQTYRYINHNTKSYVNHIKNKRMQLYQLYFSIDDFTEYLIDILPKCEKSLDAFEKIDKEVKLLELIVENYTIGIINKVMAFNKYDIDAEIRDVKLKSILGDGI